MIKWIANVLKTELEILTEYSLEYATALLMNLSLRRVGKNKCEEADVEILKVLNELLDHENPQVRTYVNGTLYSVFTREKLKEEAKELGMKDALGYLISKSDEQFRRQIQYILEQLNSAAHGEGDNLSEEGEEEEDDLGGEDDEDNFEGEDEEEDEEESSEEGEFGDRLQGVFVGEELLIKEFRADEEESRSQEESVRKELRRVEAKRAGRVRESVAEEDEELMMFKRPATPYSASFDKRNTPDGSMISKGRRSQMPASQ